MTDIPESTLPYPPIHTDKKFVVLTDWSVWILLNMIPSMPETDLTLSARSTTWAFALQGWNYHQL